MAWQDELKTASFRGIPFETKGISLSRSKKGGVREIPQSDKPTFQDLGNTGKQFQVECFFISDDYITDRDDFIAALVETGPGSLVTPTHGTISNAFPTQWTEIENVNENGGRAQFNVTFVEVLAPAGAVQSQNTEQQIADDLDNAEQNIIDDFTDNVDYENPAEQSQGLADFNSALSSIKGEIQTIVDAADISEFLALVDTLENSVSSLLSSGQIATLISGYTRLIRYPAKAIQKVSSIISTINNFISDALSLFDSSLDKSLSKNQGHLAEALSSAALLTLNEFANNGEFTSRKEAVNAINEIDSTFEDIRDSLDIIENEFDTLNSQDQYRQSEDTAQDRTEITTLVVQSLLDKSFSLSIEKSIVLITPKPLLLLAWELYGDIDKIDELIDVNSIIDPTLITAGTRIIYYA